MGESLHYMKATRIIFALLSSILLIACSKEEEWSPYVSKVTMAQATAGADGSKLAVVTKGDPSFTYTAVVSSGSDFASLDGEGEISRKGSVGETFYVYCKKNTSESPRYGQITVKYSNGYNAVLEFSQLGHTETSGYDRAWGEQPAYKSGSSYVYKTFYTTLASGKGVRNYSVCFDTQCKVSRWVAYPIHTAYTAVKNYKVGTSTAGRTDAWAYEDAITEYQSSSPYYRITGYADNEPVISQSNQAYIESTYNSGWVRGHMLPSATRYSTWQTNAQTFYSTNIMPQNYDLNGGYWSKLENSLRNSNNCADTVFVVVGCLFEKTTTTTDKKGKSIRVPSHIFKLMLRTRKGNTGKSISSFTSASDLKSIAFLFENSSAGDVPLTSAATSVSDVEKRAGFTFFRNLPETIASDVKSQKNISDWNF